MWLDAPESRTQKPMESLLCKQMDYEFVQPKKSIWSFDDAQTTLIFYYYLQDPILL